MPGRRGFVLVLTATLLSITLSPSPARANAGDLDLSFSDDGVTRADFSADGYDAAFGVALQTDGKIVVAGEGGDQGHFALARFGTGGSLDRSFGGDGKVETDFTTAIEWANDVAIDSSGRIVAGGIAWGGQQRFALARYIEDGSPDTSFSKDGRLRTSFGTGIDAGANAIALQADGKIVAVGTAGGLFALARYNPDGSPDSSFGSGGQVTTGGGPEEAFDVAILDTGKILVAGAGGSKFVVARYEPDGSLDTSFGRGGWVMTGFGTEDAAAYGMVVQSDRKIVVAGRNGFQDAEDFAVVRYLAGGKLDRSFGVGGKVLTDFSGSSFDSANAVAVQSDGRIVVAGTTVPELGPCASGYRIGVARYDADGSLDPSFGAGGKVTTGLSDTDEGNDVALQTDGKIVVAGFTGGFCDNSKFAVLRYLAA